jgi:hypothetical protein
MTPFIGEPAHAREAHTAEVEAREAGRAKGCGPIVIDADAESRQRLVAILRYVVCQLGEWPEHRGRWGAEWERVRGVVVGELNKIES